MPFSAATVVVGVVVVDVVCSFLDVSRFFVERFVETALDGGQTRHAGRLLVFPELVVALDVADQLGHVGEHCVTTQRVLWWVFA